MRMAAISDWPKVETREFPCDEESVVGVVMCERITWRMDAESFAARAWWSAVGAAVLRTSRWPTDSTAWSAADERDWCGRGGTSTIAEDSSWNSTSSTHLISPVPRWSMTWNICVLLHPNCYSYLSRRHCSISRVSLACWNRHRCCCCCRRRHRCRRRVLACDWPDERPSLPLAAAVAAVARRDNFDIENNADVDEHTDDVGVGNHDVELELEQRLRSSVGCARASLPSSLNSDWCSWSHRHTRHCRRNRPVARGACDGDGR